jgi:hypothetical protein
MGKTTCIVVNPDGKYDPEHYAGMDPKSTVIIESDRKDLPFPSNGQWNEGRNVLMISDKNEIVKELTRLNSIPQVKTIYIDTMNGIMLDKEMNDIKKKTYDKWADLAQEIYSLITFCNTEMRPDIIVYLSGHTTVFTDADGEETKCLVTNGKKLEKIKLESKLPIVLFTSMTKGLRGANTYEFETQANRSTAKSPINMFQDFLIPNSLRLVDDTIRKYYGI